MNRFLTPDEAARRIGTHRATINRWIVAGHLVRYRVNGKGYVLEQQLLLVERTMAQRGRRRAKLARQYANAHHGD